METVRIIPCLDVDAGRVVKGVNFVGLRDAGDPVEMAARYDREGADELVFLDITASSDERETTLDMVRRVAALATPAPARFARPPPRAGGGKGRCRAAPCTAVRPPSVVLSLRSARSLSARNLSVSKWP